MINAFKHIYAHVPFCNGKCGYCGFFSDIYDESHADLFIEALSKEFDHAKQNIPNAGNSQPKPETIYFGGGTPSILSASQLEHLCKTILERVCIDNLKEWTIEINPGTLDNDKIAILKNAGVNRFSMGAQSFQDRILASIKRRHSHKDIIETVEILRTADINNIGLDLIACLPGMDSYLWQKDLYELLKIRPEHSSIYALSIEENSQFANDGVELASADDQLLMLETAEIILNASDYYQYEISNYAKKDYECIHNLAFWRGEDYLGLGPAATSRSENKRWTNLSNTNEYIQSLQEQELPARTEELLDVTTNATERLIYHLRLNEGIDLNAFLSKFNITNKDLTQHWQSTFQILEKQSLIQYVDNRWVLTKTGRNVADAIAEALILNPKSQI